jgi:hypothetical protein
MLRSHSLFGQILSLISRSEFARHVKDLKAERYSKGFRAWDQLVAMLFCHLAQAKSLREITGGLKSCLGNAQPCRPGCGPRAFDAGLRERAPALDALRASVP